MQDVSLNTLPSHLDNPQQASLHNPEAIPPLRSKDFFRFQNTHHPHIWARAAVATRTDQVIANGLTFISPKRLESPVALPVLHSPIALSPLSESSKGEGASPVTLLVAPSMELEFIDKAMTFRKAGERFMELRAAPNPMGRVQFAAPRTMKDYKKKQQRLNIHFGDIPLQQITYKDLAEYQRRRASGEGFTRKLGKEVVVATAGAAKINAELAHLIQLMTMAGCWNPLLARCYKRLQELDSALERALTPAEQDRFLSVAASNPDWHTVYWYAIVAIHTTFSSDEMRTLRQGDINLTYQTLSVNRLHGKNRHRRREIPIVDPDCTWALERLLERAGRLIGHSPSFPLFPFRCVRNLYDSTKPMSESGMRKKFEEVREAAGVPDFKLNGFRHTAITRLAESGVPISVIMRRAGHVTAAMTEHYTHISEQAERLAISRVSSRTPILNGDRAALRMGSVGY